MATAAIAGHLSDSLVGHPHCSITTTTTTLLSLCEIFVLIYLLLLSSAETAFLVLRAQKRFTWLKQKIIYECNTLNCWPAVEKEMIGSEMVESEMF